MMFFGAGRGSLFSPRGGASIPAVHNVHFVDFVFLPTEQAATYLKICILTYLLTYINPSSFDWKENTFFLIFVNSKL